MSRPALILALAALVACAQAEEFPVESIDTAVTIYVGPVFLTGDPDFPEAEAVAVDAEGRIVEVYARTPQGSPWPVVTVPGMLALPGLHDAHLHVSGIGKLEEQVQLVGCKSVNEAVERVRVWSLEHPEATVIRGRGWDQSLWPDKAFPHREHLVGLDDRPIYLRRVDGHAAWLNSAALRMAGITAATPDPEGGRIHRDPDGEPTGVLIDNAIDLFHDKLPDPTPAERERWILAGLDACADAGLVAVHDMGQSVATCDVAERLAAEGRLPIRLFVYMEGSDDDSMGAMAKYARHDRFTVMGMKYYTDGALGSRGAALLADYADETGRRGLLVTDPDELDRKVDMVHRRGFQTAIHAIGDHGNRVALDAIHKSQYGKLGRRHRVEHAQVVHPDDFAVFSEVGAIASMQPTHCTSDLRWAEQRLGPDRVKGAYAWRTFRDRGVPLAFGSDAPVEHWDPCEGIYASLTRRTKGGEPEGGWYPDEALDLESTLHAFTNGAAFAVHREDDLGVLKRGFLFDLTVLDRDPRSDARDWLDAEPTAVFVGGERVR